MSDKEIMALRAAGFDEAAYIVETILIREMEKEKSPSAVGAD